MDLNKRFQSRRFVPLLGGGVLTNASLEQVIPGLSLQQYSLLCEQIKAKTVGATVLRKSDSKLSGYPDEQDVIVLKYLPMQSFSPTKAKGSPEEWQETRARISTQVKEGLDELDEEELIHADLRTDNIFVDKSPSSPDKNNYLLGDLGKARKRKRSDGSEHSIAMRRVDDVREDVVSRISPPKGARSQRWSRPSVRTRLIFP